MGAAIQAAIHRGDPSESIKDQLLLDTQYSSIGYAGKNGQMIFVLQKDTTIPAKKSTVIQDPEIDSNNMVKVKIYEGENLNVNNNLFWREVSFGPVPKDDMVQVQFELMLNAMYPLI